ncbi:tRNA lysidine(34) synthetase TilS [Stackebrandtia soli]|uniref:tRNA lysidine(34) synthetase TilS n=1 Tax=Stackebrandtia soli TaxID=1892856 RepID=UPI0039EBB775
MSRLAAPVARTRTAVRAALVAVPRGATVIVACSGGADSTALAHACAFVAPRIGLTCGLVTVDHGLQEGSADRAAAVAAMGRDLGMAFADVAAVTVGRAGGPEGAARSARYAALDAAGERHGAAAILLGHTRDDQAETVLLALARGSGPRGLSGMPVRRGVYVRPFLDVSRVETVAACVSQGADTWDDPHNVDPAYARSRVRAAMPVLVDVFGPRFVANLARTASLVAEDATTLDAIAAEALAVAVMGTERAAGAGSSTREERSTSRLPVAAVRDLPRAIRTRVLHRFAVAAGADDADLAYVHIDAMDALVARWRGQGPVHLPGGVTVARDAGVLRTARS